MEKLIYKIKAYTGYEAYVCTYICDDGTVLIKEELSDGKVLGHYVRDTTLQCKLSLAEKKLEKCKEQRTYETSKQTGWMDVDAFYDKELEEIK